LSATFPQLMQAHAAGRPDAPALREKRLGIWQTLSWRELAALVEAAAGGLAPAKLAQYRARAAAIAELSARLQRETTAPGSARK